MIRRRKVSKRNDALLTATAVLASIIDSLGIDDYRCPRSNHIYSAKQKIVLLVLRQFVSLPYRDFCDMISSFTRICRTIGLKHVPHHTTLAKFSKTLDGDLLQKVISSFSVVCGHDVTVGIDGTGFSEMRISAYFSKRKKDFGLPQEPDKMKGFSKATYAGDMDTKMILVCDIVDQHNHDVTRVPPVVAHLKRTGVDVEFVVADRGYDAEWVHRLVKEELGATALIPPRECAKTSKGNKTPAMSGRNRNRMRRVLVKCTVEQLRYQMRSIIECINSMVKRKMGGCVFSRLDETKRTELMCRAIAHNMRRVLDLGCQDLFV